MRIAHIANFFVPELGYIEYYLAKKEQIMGHEVCIITSDRYPYSDKRFHKSASSYQIEDGLKVYRLPCVFELSDEVFLPLGAFKKSLLDFRPDVVHVHSTLSPIGFASTLFKKSGSYKIVSNVISGQLIAKKLSLSVRLQLAVKYAFLKVFARTLWLAMAEKIDAFYAVSEAAVNWMVENLKVNPKRVYFFPLAADSDLFKFSAKERLRIRKNLGIRINDVVCIFTGKFANDKKVDVLLKSAAPLLRSHSDFKILLVGSCSSAYLQYLRQIISQEQIGNQVIIHNLVHRTELSAFYSAADFAIWPCGMSISIIEAMSTSLPVIIAQLNWTNHLLGNNNGLDFPEGNVAAMRNCIRILLENHELRQEMGNNSRKLVEEKLNWDTITTQYLHLYSKLCNPHLNT